MKDSSLISLLKTFSRSEFNSFEKFILSPYFSDRKRIRINKVTEYFKALKKFYPDFKGKKFTNENLYKIIYPETEYKDHLMRKINSDLLKLAESFLIQLELEENEIESRKFLISQLTRRRQEKLFNKSFDSMVKYLNGLERDEDYFYETYNVWQRYWDFYYGKKNVYKLEDVVSNINNYFIYVLLGSLRIYLWAISYLRFSNKKIDLLMYEDIMNYTEKNIDKLSSVPQILFYFYMIKLIKGKDELYFQRLKKLRETKFRSLTSLDKQNFFIMMTNYCNEKTTAGNTKYMKERFELDKDYLKLLKGLKIKSLHNFFILGASKNANRLGEFKWVNNILKEFEKFTMDENKDFMINYIKADMYFLQHNYSDAIDHLSAIKTPYSNQKQNIRNLMIQIYFEMSQTDSLISLIDTSKHFLNRDKHLKKIFKTNSLNFIKYTERLIKLIQNPKIEDIQFIRNELLNNSDVTNKEWLLEKLDKIS